MERATAEPAAVERAAAEPSTAPEQPNGKHVRRILHCDMDCFYAQVHMRDDPSLRGKPVVIGGSPQGRGVVAAASYEARAFGIRSAMPAAQAVRRCPQAIFLKPEFSRYRQESDRIFEIFRRFTPIVQTASLDEAYLDVTDHLGKHPGATAVAREIRRQVLEERRLTVSVGVGPNRLIAKIASDFHKPDGLTVVRPDQVRAFLDPQPVRRIHGIGPATEKALAALGVKTIGDLRRLPRDLLVERFGRHGAGMWRSAQGLDDRPVRVERRRKSLGHERTYAQDLETLEAMDEQLDLLAGKVADGLARRELEARTITVKVRYDDFTTKTRARSQPERARFSAERLAAVGKELLRQTEAGRRRVRLLGLTASGFEREEPQAQPSRQLALFEPSLDGGGQIASSIGSIGT
ncbi:MAG: DNA polymerase IV [Acidobacteriota bacterium]